ncbi:MAG: MurR/RpiR family transcriptional regulator [Clostridia bacterium]
MTNFNQEIKSVYKNLTKTEKKVADYVLKNPKKVLYLAINELADECEVGDTSVYRFCRSIGLRGYQEFKVRLSLSLNDDVSFSVSSIQNADFKEMANAIAKKYNNAVNKTMSVVNEQAVNEIVDNIINAKNVYLFGIGASGITALDALTHFIRITSKVRFVNDIHTQVMISNILSEDDFVLFISHSGETLENISIAKNAKNSGAKLACITMYPDSTLASLCDTCLVYGAFDAPTSGSAIDIRIAQLYAVDLIYQAYYLRDKENSQNAISKTNAAIIEQLY